MSMPGTDRLVNHAGTVNNTRTTCKIGSGPIGTIPADALAVYRLIGANTPGDAALKLDQLGLSPVPLFPTGAMFEDEHGKPIRADDRTPIFTDWAKSRPATSRLKTLYKNHPEAGNGLKLGKQLGRTWIVELHIPDPGATEHNLVKLAPEGLPPTAGSVYQDGTDLLFLGDRRRLEGLDPVVVLAGGTVLKTRSVATDTTTMAVIPPTPEVDGTPRRWNGCPWIAPLPEAIYAALLAGGDPEPQGIEPTEPVVTTVEGPAEPVVPAAKGPAEPTSDTQGESTPAGPGAHGQPEVAPESEGPVDTCGGFGGGPSGPSSSPEIRPDGGEHGSGAASMPPCIIPGPDPSPSPVVPGSAQVAEGSDHADEARRDPEKHRVESRHDDDERDEQEHGELEDRPLEIDDVEDRQFEVVYHADGSKGGNSDASSTNTGPESVTPTVGPVTASPGDGEHQVEDANPTPVIAPPAQERAKAIGDQTGQVSGEAANDEAVGRVEAVPPDQSQGGPVPSHTPGGDWTETLDLNQGGDGPPTFGEVLDWVRLYLGPGQVVELRILGAKDDPASDRPPFIVSGFYDFDHLEEMVEEAWRWTPKAKGVYILPNPIEPELQALRQNRTEKYAKRTGNDEDVIRRHWMLVDVDPDRISATTGNKLTSDLSATDDEKARARSKIATIGRHLRALGWPAPICVDSGNGYQLVYRIDEPPDDGGLVQKCLKALAAKFDGDGVVVDPKVSNPARIMKMPGTMSRKGDHTHDRPHRWARVLAAPAEPQVVPHELLVALAAEAPTAATPAARAKTPAKTTRPGPTEATSPAAAPPTRARVATLPATTGIAQPGGSTPLSRRAALYLDKLPEAVAGENGHDRTFHAACVLAVGFGLDVEEAMPILSDWNQTHCKPPWTEPELRHKLEGAVQKAREEPDRVGHLVLATGNSTSDTLNTYPMPAVGNPTIGRGGSPGQGAFARDGSSWPRPPAEPAFYGLAGDIVHAIEPHTEADPVGLLVQFLVVFGSMIGRSAYITAEAARHHTNLFAVLVGPTSKGRKGSSLAQIRKLAAGVDPKWDDYRVLSGLSSGEGLIWAVRDPIEKDEAIKDKKTGAVTGYRKVKTDVGIEDKRLLALESEFALVLKVLAREGNTLSALTRQAWDTGVLRTLTKNTPAQATGAHISIIGHITRDEVGRYMTETELANGFANRFLWVGVRRSKSLPHGGNFDLDANKPLVDRLKQAAQFARKRGELKRSPMADKLWEEAYPYLSEGQPGLLGAVLGRAEAQVMRMATLYALLDQATEIRVPHLLAALALWRYVEESARYIFGSSVGDRDADTLLAAVRASSEGLTRAEIYRDVFRNNKPAARINEALGLLLQHDLVERREDEAEGPGRAAERFRAKATPT